ncbi:MAG: (Fe-S)-binding protein [Pirellulaceae bacterium]
MKISLMVTCLADVIRPTVGKAVVRLLRQLGHTIEFPQEQTCCGQPMFNSGYMDLAREQARHTIRVFEHCETVVVPSGSCAAMVKVEYPRLFAEEPKWRERAAALSERVFEFTDFLVNRLEVVDVGARFEGKVTCHYSCHLRLLGATDEVEQLIHGVADAIYVPLQRRDQCCGFGGSFAVRYPRISTALVKNKARCIVDSGADAVVSTDLGCLMNIGGRLRREGQEVEVLHIAELLERT